MGAVPAEDWDLVGWNAEYSGKVQLWNAGEEDWSGNSRKWMYITLLSREMSLEKLIFVVFKEKVVKPGRFFSSVSCSEPCRQRWPLLGEMDTGSSARRCCQAGRTCCPCPLSSVAEPAALP